MKYLLLLILAITQSNYLPPLYYCSASSEYSSGEGVANTEQRACEIAFTICMNATPPQYCCCILDKVKKIRK